MVSVGDKVFCTCSTVNRDFNFPRFELTSYHQSHLSSGEITYSYLNYVCMIFHLAEKTGVKRDYFNQGGLIFFFNCKQCNHGFGDHVLFDTMKNHFGTKPATVSKFFILRSNSTANNIPRPHRVKAYLSFRKVLG